MSEEKRLNRDELCVAAIRGLIIDMTNKAKSGHPGMAIDAAPILYALYRDHLVASPKHPDWINRDRFVLSSGHNSPLLYAMLHASGYGVSIDDIKNFRQFGSITPGHPEVGRTPGVDASGGPLGQGIGQALGMALAEASLSSRYPDGERLFNHFTYCLCGDGCLQEGLSQEAISLAGLWHLGKLILIYDANTSTLDGPTSDTFNEDVGKRFEASGWEVQELKDGNDIDAVSKAISKAKKNLDQPSLIIVHTIIGYGSSFQGTSKTHGAPLGVEDGTFAKHSYGFDHPEFFVPEEVYQALADSFGKRGEEAYATYEATLREYKEKHPDEFKVFEDSLSGNVEAYLPEVSLGSVGDKEATRSSSGSYIAALDEACPFLIGGAADVASSVKTQIKGEALFSKDNHSARSIGWGIREFAMASAQNGILLHGGLRSYCGSFLVFSDYMKNAIRMSALEHLPAIYVFSHDSLAVGEDGPTHQPIEQLAALRSIPGVRVIRPADRKETIAAWEVALHSKHHPTCLILSRQNLPIMGETDPESVRNGAYFLKKAKKADCQIIATGSEASLALETAKILEEKGIFADVVSMPSMELFAKQDQEYQDEILRLPYERRISLEMLSTFGWGKYAKTNIGYDRFGESAPAGELLLRHGFTPEAIAEKIIVSLKREVR